LWQTARHFSVRCTVFRFACFHFLSVRCTVFRVACFHFLSVGGTVFRFACFLFLSVRCTVFRYACFLTFPACRARSVGFAFVSIEFPQRFLGVAMVACFSFHRRAL
jgi:hypothetical protein